LLYKQELPTMDYAANTGRKSGFLEKCVTNGKYKTLVLSSTAGYEEVTAALSYQLVPADTQYAEIPLAVVRPPYQRVGIGQLLYKELSQRLRNVGVTTIFCWADNVSEGFWLKQASQNRYLNKSNCFHFHLHNEYAFITYGQQMLETSNLMLALF
jgi:GNAT superfamily N-acetyltransferase